LHATSSHTSRPSVPHGRSPAAAVACARESTTTKSRRRAAPDGRRLLLLGSSQTYCHGRSSTVAPILPNRWRLLLLPTVDDTSPPSMAPLTSLPDLLLPALVAGGIIAHPGRACFVPAAPRHAWGHFRQRAPVPSAPMRPPLGSVLPPEAEAAPRRRRGPSLRARRTRAGLANTPTGAGSVDYSPSRLAWLLRVCRRQKGGSTSTAPPSKRRTSLHAALGPCDRALRELVRSMQLWAGGRKCVQKIQTG
jgi:hypothetical protein